MFKTDQLWNVDVTITPQGFASRHFSGRLYDPQMLADTLRALARQVERENGLRPVPQVDETEGHGPS